MKYATVGSISHGTLRTEDLLDAFASELEDCITRNPELELAERERLTRLVWDAREFDEETADYDGTELVIELKDALQEFAPPYCYFGASEGDGSDFGFWPSMEQIEELPRIADSDPDRARELGEDCIYVNDHGNVTVYGADGSVVLELV